jgi:hypothetical protein
MRAQEDSGIQEELKTYGISKEKFYREKEIAAISLAASMLCDAEASPTKLERGRQLGALAHILKTF